MKKIKFGEIFALFMVSLLLAGCMGFGNSVTFDNPDPDADIVLSNASPFDGVWRGSLLKSAGSDRCRTHRLGLRFEIKKQVMIGSVKRDDRSYFMNGDIDENGSIIELKIGGYYGGDEIFLEGDFSPDHIVGTWQSKFCSGQWSADRLY
ncbi:MAG: hypothetical protein AB8B77_05325 [Alphaproteobacteria bacterium]